MQVRLEAARQPAPEATTGPIQNQRAGTTASTGLSGPKKPNPNESTPFPDVRPKDANGPMHTLIVYSHLIAACIAVGVLLMQDLALSKLGGRRLNIGAVKELQRAAQIIQFALGALWASGIVLVAVGAWNDPNYLANQKLWAKIAVVVVLTANGALLHSYSFPRVISATGVIGLPFLEKSAVVATGAVSTVSWLFACYLGVARPWNHTVQFDGVMYLYLSLLMPACVAALVFIHGFARSKPALHRPTQQSTGFTQLRAAVLRRIH